MPATATTTELSDVLGFITGASEDDIAAVRSALAHRSAEAMRNNGDVEITRLPILAVGMLVAIEGIRPKYLVGLRGTVTKMNTTTCEVTLDEASTRKLAATNQSRFHVNPDQPFRIPGRIPLACCKVVKP